MEFNSKLEKWLWRFVEEKDAYEEESLLSSTVRTSGVVSLKRS